MEDPELTYIARMTCFFFLTKMPETYVGIKAVSLRNGVEKVYTHM